MIIKMNNKSENFYEYMGKFFGSRVVERQTNDRIYDDNNKQWYLYVDKDRVLAFVSINDRVIKNVYAIEEKYLEEILNEILKENQITFSVVTNVYEDVYKKCGFKIEENKNYKKFVTIYASEDFNKNLAKV